ncbi:hypothetical protein RND71_027449 [Anisodus tanguticus]|uniref:DUF4283 domain-containing protein n=1 Tax=Anisodus tanguticus TaxID=243964 RepID=A0AAE1RHM2_9SOLA|nr:hypothetical protein RND71_027449 [Anisodus tanguticus]
MGPPSVAETTRVESLPASDATHLVESAAPPQPVATEPVKVTNLLIVNLRSCYMRDEVGSPSTSSPTSCTLGLKDTSSSSNENKLDGPTKTADQTKKNTAWNKLFKGNRDTSNGLKLHFVPQSQHDDPTEFEDDYFDVVSEKWGHILVGYFAGKYPGGPALQKLCRSWGVKYNFNVHITGWIVFKFQTGEDKDNVLTNGPHFVYGTTLLMKDLPECFAFDTQEICTMPLWVRLPSLPLELWNERALSHIFSRVDRSIATDKLTHGNEQTSFARALVEVDLSKDIVHFVELNVRKGPPFWSKKSFMNSFLIFAPNVRGLDTLAQIARHTQRKPNGVFNVTKARRSRP